MKIGIILPHVAFTYYAGIPIQGRFWKEGLESLGHQVYLLNNWDQFDYDSLEYLIILGQGIYMSDIVNSYKRYPNIKIISAPIIDWHKSLLEFKLRCKYLGWHKGGLIKPLHELYEVRNNVDFFLARSEYEKNIISKGLNVDPSKIHIVPISLRFQELPEIDFSQKEDFCLHVSRLRDPGKNVTRLIEAAKKYGFKLKLAGTLHGKDRKWLDNLISGSNNIEYLGRLSDTELLFWYNKAKVFALPSIIEGVGCVALEAAVYGSEIVLTNIGGPKEYYSGRAVLVNPYSVDSIGKGIEEAFNKKKAQPELREYIIENYTLIACCKKLEEVLLNNL